MTNHWLTRIAATALIAAEAVAAQAADLPTTKAPPAPVFLPPPFTWTGFYVGLNAGAVWSMGSRTTSLFVPATASWITTYYPTNLGNSDTGFIGGGTRRRTWTGSARRARA